MITRNQFQSNYNQAAYSNKLQKKMMRRTKDLKLTIDQKFSPGMSGAKFKSQKIPPIDQPLQPQERYAESSVNSLHSLPSISAGHKQFKGQLHLNVKRKSAVAHFNQRILNAIKGQRTVESSPAKILKLKSPRLNESFQASPTRQNWQMIAPKYPLTPQKNLQQKSPLKVQMS